MVGVDYAAGEWFIPTPKSHLFGSHRIGYWSNVCFKITLNEALSYAGQYSKYVKYVG